MYDIIKGKVVNPQEYYDFLELCTLRAKQEHCKPEDCANCHIYSSLQDIAYSLSDTERLHIEINARKSYQQNKTRKIENTIYLGLGILSFIISCILCSVM